MNETKDRMMNLICRNDLNETTKKYGNQSIHAYKTGREDKKL